MFTQAVSSKITDVTAEPKSEGDCHSPVLSSRDYKSEQLATGEKVLDPNQKSLELKSLTDATVGIKVQKTDELACIAHFLSPARTGIFDELMALVKTEVLKIEHGVAVLTDDWVTKVDYFLLEDMDRSWSLEKDPDGKYCVNNELRSHLEGHWTKSEHGWALIDQQDELIYDFEELEEWRRTFEGKVEAKENISEGIGRFGL